MVTSFTYTPFSVSNEIRLLVLEPGESLPITCRLIHVRLSDKPDYEAVSYTWLREQDIGSQAQYDNIMLDNNEFRVTPNCYAALQHFRSVSHETVLWVDAICIDQENESEKNHQVQQMATIYPHANRVRIWLGVEELDDKIAVKYIYQLYSFFSRAAPDHRRLNSVELMMMPMRAMPTGRHWTNSCSAAGFGVVGLFKKLLWPQRLLCTVVTWS